MDHGHQQCPIGYSSQSASRRCSLPADTPTLNPTGAPKDVCGDDDGDDALRSFVPFHVLMLRCCEVQPYPTTPVITLLFSLRAEDRSVTWLRNH